MDRSRHIDGQRIAIFISDRVSFSRDGCYVLIRASSGSRLLNPHDAGNSGGEKMSEYEYPRYSPTGQNWLTSRPGTKGGYHGGNDNPAPAHTPAYSTCYSGPRQVWLP
jgi:hypothetical protein